MTSRPASFWRLGGGWYLALLLILACFGAALFLDTATLEIRRDLARLALGDRLAELDGARREAVVARQLLRDANVQPNQGAYLVVSITDRRIWYKERGSVLFTTGIATGSGKTLVKEEGDRFWKFDTPRGRLSVTSKELDPWWVPPDWFYLEHARTKRLALLHLSRRKPLALADGSLLKVEGADVVRRYPDGERVVLQASEEKDIVVNGKLLVPPLGTNQRRFDKVLGSHRLNLESGYALHGTNRPETIGQAVSHGCVRLTNEDIAKLYQMVPVGTPVFLY
ncbi:L,D-transpeptidase [Geomonas limicola]|uniref:L,D-transpeptidase n=1 Tax=Geomonas limicola TaxID=2740186 RepID=UPI001609D504|nr:L,D-transpeptidase [Geomonas limicola]